MIRSGVILRAGVAGLVLAGLAGCASSPMRMPPTTATAYGAGVPAPYAAPYAVAPAPAPYAPPYGAPQAAPAPYDPSYAPAPYAPVPTPAAPFPAPLPDAPAPASGIAGLTERNPDLCKASTYASSLGQPGSTIPGLGLPGEYRVVEYRGIEPQDYNPDRIVFRLDATGTITKIDCG